MGAKLCRLPQRNAFGAQIDYLRKKDAVENVLKRLLARLIGAALALAVQAGVMEARPALTKLATMMRQTMTAGHGSKQLKWAIAGA